MSVLSIDELPESERHLLSSASVIRAQVAQACWRLGLTDHQRIECENAALDDYWRHAHSVAWCVATGNRKAREFAS